MTTEMDGDGEVEAAAPRTGQIPVLAVIALGGACGALARYGIGTAWPHAASAFDWPTFVINVTGCLFMGVLMVVLTEFVPGSPLVRPFLGIGVLGGYTTFSTYVVGIQKNADAGAPLTALTYMVATAVAALLAVWAGDAAATVVVRRSSREKGLRKEGVAR